MIKKIIEAINQNQTEIDYRVNLLSFMAKDLTKAEKEPIKAKIKTLLKIKKQLLKTFEELQKQ